MRLIEIRRSAAGAHDQLKRGLGEVVRIARRRIDAVFGIEVCPAGIVICDNEAGCRVGDGREGELDA